MPARPKRHHYVPRAYLDRFASDGQVQVRWRDGRQYLANPKNVAVETGFYDIPDAHGEKSSVVEEGLAEADSSAIDVLRRIDVSGAAPEPQDRDRHALALFMAL